MLHIILIKSISFYIYHKFWCGYSNFNKILITIQTFYFYNWDIQIMIYILIKFIHLHLRNSITIYIWRIIRSIYFFNAQCMGLEFSIKIHVHFLSSSFFSIFKKREKKLIETWNLLYAIIVKSSHKGMEDLGRVVSFMVILVDKKFKAIL